MSHNPLPEFTEELQLGHLKPEQYFAAAQLAIKNIGWHLVSISGYTITCHTPGGASFGESITITIDSGKVVFHSRSVNEYYWVDGQNGVNAALFKNAIALIIEKNEKAERSRSPVNREQFGALIPSQTYLVTPVLIYLNTLVFIIMIVCGVAPLEPQTQSLLAWGGNFARPATTDGGWWRLFTYMFLHAGILHLLMNMYALLYIGMFLEPLIGKFRFAAAYLLTGLCAGLMSIAIHSYTVGVGASGAIFGMYGIFLAMLTTSHIEKTVRNTMLRSILFFVVFNLVSGMQGNIDNAAHIGGLLSGLIIGYIYYPGITRHSGIKQQAGITSIMAAAIVLLIAFTFPRLTNDLAVYDRKMKEFAEIESMALKAGKMNEQTPKEEMLYNLKDRGIYYWNKEIQILNEITPLDLPPLIRSRNEELLKYCRLRIEVYGLLYRQINEGTTAYTPEINEDNIKIAQIIDGVKGK